MSIRYLALLLFLCIAKLCYCSSRVIDVHPSTLKNATHFGSLQYYLCGNGSFALLPGTVLSIASSSHHTLLTGPFCLLTHLSNITLTSDSLSKPAQIVCESFRFHYSRGLGFYSAIDLKLHLLRFHHCSGTILDSLHSDDDSRIYFPPNLSAVLLIAQSSNVKMSRVSITGKYCGYGLVINASYNVFLETVNFLHDTDCNSSKSCFNSGLLLFSPPSNNEEILESVIRLSDVNIKHHCNYYRRVDVEWFLQDTEKRIPVTDISAGGLTALLLNDRPLGFSSKILVANLAVTGNKGGGALILYLLNDRSPPVYINDSAFSQNTASYGAGLVIYLAAASKYLTHAVDQTHLWAECVVCLEGISASGQVSNDYGGGIYIAVGSANNTLVPPVLLAHSYISYNSACKGATGLYVHGFSLRKDRFSKVFPQVDFEITLRTVFVFDNGLYLGVFKAQRLSETVTTEFVNIKRVVIETSQFHHNFGSAVFAYCSTVRFIGNILFQSNKGMHGGAIYLNYGSFLIIENSTKIHFKGNSAYGYGGAIYSSDKYCPVNFTAKQSGVLIFEDNFALLEGDAVYFRGLQYCWNTMLVSHFHFRPRGSPSGHLSISSPATKLAFCNAPQNQVYDLYPGTTITLSLKALDYNNNESVYSPIYVNFAENNVSYEPAHSYQFHEGENIRLLTHHSSEPDGECTSLNFTILQKYKENNTYCYIVLGILGQLPSLTVRINMHDCPLGFEMAAAHGGANTCDCDDFLVLNHISEHCDINTLQILIKSSSWLGAVIYDNISETIKPPTKALDNDTVMLLGHATICPPGYCNNTITKLDISQRDHLCRGHRTGILCGDCANGYSVVWGSTACVECTHYNVWAILAIPVVSLLAILMLFLTRLTISNGCLGAIIFYANVNAVSLFYSIEDRPWYVKVILFFLSCLNDTVDVPICLSSHLTSVGKSWSFFVFPAFLISIVLALVFVSRYSPRVSNFIAPSSIQVIATLFYFSFAKVLLTVIDILTPVKIRTPVGTYIVWYTNGNIPFWNDARHIMLSIVAFASIILLLLPFLLFTTCGSLLLKIRRLRPYSIYIRPFVDAYQGPYRNSCKFWFGLRLWLVVYIYACFAYFRGYKPVFTLISQLLPLLFFIVLQAYVKPYQKSFTNIVDLVIMLDLSLRYLVSFYFYFVNTPSHSWIYLTVLSLFVMLMFCGLVGQHLLKVVSKTKFCQRQKMRFSVTQRNKDEYESLPDDSDAQLREPLLEN